MSFPFAAATATMVVAAPFVGCFGANAVRRSLEGKGFLFGRSCCDACGRQLEFRDLVPILSWLLQVGRCRHCSAPITRLYPAVEFGRINSQVFTDTTVTPNKKYVEKHDIHGDGTEQTLHLLLADNAFKDERVDYTYDSAGRTKSVKYNDGANRDLFTASGSTAIYDVFGRINTAQYGLARFDATYAASGRPAEIALSTALETLIRCPECDHGHWLSEEDRRLPWE